VTSFPRVAQWLLRLSPVERGRRTDVEADLHELFEQRLRARGRLHAYRRLYQDLASLWLQARSSADTRPSVTAILRDAADDLKFGVRLFARQRAVLPLTIAGLSVGLGIATAAFSIMNAAVFRGEGLVEPNRAPGILKTTDHSTSTTWSYDEFLHLREGSAYMQVEGLVTDSVAVRTSSAQSEGRSARCAFVSGGFFTATGGHTIAGRALQPADEPAGSAPPIVVSFDFWTSMLHRDTAVLGRRLIVGHAVATIVGIAEPGFAVPQNRTMWIPLTAYGAVYGFSPEQRAPESGVQVFGRLLPDASLPEAESQLSGVASGLSGDVTGTNGALRVRLDPHVGLGRMPSSDVVAISAFVMAVIGLVLLLACANAGTVLTATAIAREREMGVRAALGASRGRIVRQLVTESLALGTVSAGIGLLLASWAIPTIGRMIEAPPGTHLGPDIHVYVFLAVVTLVTGVAAGLAPAWHARGVDLLSALKGEGAASNRLMPRRLRAMLVGTQAAISVLLIVLAALFVRATFRAAAVDVGFDPEGLFAIASGPDNPAVTPGRMTATFWDRALPQLATIPGVRSVTLAELTPFGDKNRIALSGDPRSPVATYFNRVRGDYFRTMGLAILSGRTFSIHEISDAAPVALVTASVARMYFPGRTPIGEMLPMQIPIATTRPVIIGVVGDTIVARLHEASRFAVYEPLDPERSRSAELLIRISPGAGDAIRQATERLRSIDPHADFRVASVESRLQQEAGRPRMLAMITGVVGAMAIVLCVIGLYGLTMSLVEQRAREMGVRVALGAAPQDLLRLLVWDSLRPVIAGLVIGSGAALLAGRLFVATTFFGVSPRDPAALGGAALLIVTAATMAVLAPTIRAAGIDAASVLRRS